MLAPLSKLLAIMITDAPPVSTGVKRGEKIGVGREAMFGTGGSSSNKNDEDAKVLSKVSST